MRSRLTTWSPYTSIAALQSWPQPRPACGVHHVPEHWAERVEPRGASTRPIQASTRPIQSNCSYAMGGALNLFQNHQTARSNLRDASVTQGAATGSLARQVLRKKQRHSGLLEAVLRLDTEMDAASRQELADWITEQYRTEFDAVPLGFVSQCYLGSPYVDHRLDLIGSIVQHYSASQQMPPLFESARMLARTGRYEFVEVYLNGELKAVSSDGSTA